MAIGIVSSIADGRVRLKVYCGSAACLSRAVDKLFFGETIFVSVAEIEEWFVR